MCHGDEKGNICRADADRDNLSEILLANLKFYRIELHLYGRDLAEAGWH